MLTVIPRFFFFFSILKGKGRIDGRTALKVNLEVPAIEIFVLEELALPRGFTEDLSRTRCFSFESKEQLVCERDEIEENEDGFPAPTDGSFLRMEGVLGPGYQSFIAV